MAFWDGAPRSETTWKALRLEVSSALKMSAEDPLWQVASSACGELQTIAIGTGIKSPSSHWAVAPAQCSSEPPGTRCDAEDAASAVRSFCGYLEGREEAAVGRQYTTFRVQSSPHLSLPICPLWRTALQFLSADESLLLRLRCPRLAPLRRAEALSFLQWCRDAGINVLLRPLPHGCVARYLATRGGSMPARPLWLARHARALANAELTLHVSGRLQAEAQDRRG